MIADYLIVIFLQLLKRQLIVKVCKPFKLGWCAIIGHAFLPIPVFPYIFMNI